MPRKKSFKPNILEARSVAEEIEIERAEAAASPREMTTAPIGSALDTLMAARDAKAAIEPEAMEAEPTWQERVTRPERDPVRMESPRFAPVPDGYKNVDVYPPAGLKVNKSLDRSVAAIQFAEGDAVPSRAEKDAMQEAGLSYSPDSRQWTRHDKEQPGANLIDVKRIAAELAGERSQMASVMGL